MPEEEREQQGGGEGEGEAVDPSRIFRHEVMISDADLRVEVANEINRSISGDEVIDLEEKSINAKGSASINREGRNRVVVGNYTKTISNRETLLIGQSVKEVVKGGVMIDASREAEAIVGGAYIGSFVGPYLRICGMGDFLCWGGYVEADITRIEIAGAQIRAYCFYAHAVGARVSLHSRFIDDIATRVETIGVLTDSTTTVQDLGTPGSGQNMEN